MLTPGPSSRTTPPAWLSVLVAALILPQIVRSEVIIFERGAGVRHGRAWGPEQALGAPDTPGSGDIQTAWASATQDGQDEWLELDFDQDALLLEQINSGEFAESKIGRFLHDLKQKFEGPVVVDMLCYLRLYTELALRAKGVLMMRENGLDTPVGERTKAKFEEMRYLEESIGKTGILAMSPFLQMTRKDLWQLYVLE